MMETNSQIQKLHCLRYSLAMQKSGHQDLAAHYGENKFYCWDSNHRPLIHISLLSQGKYTRELLRSTVFFLKYFWATQKCVTTKISWNTND
jgi:hypothetical protein